uniref:Uncharacterized protein n=1 Tax=Timema cristinae TaxID=61476 RepID=A0A7R9D257_TIMCR|nr:unnamed protein product [Timema cristinae]
MAERNSGDNRRRDRERVMVQEGIELWNRKKDDQWHQKIRDQRELRDMLSKYSPWGRPGCGAPNPDSIRKRKLQLEGLYPDQDKNCSAVSLGRPGGGAPQRTPSGHVNTLYREDPLLRFQPNEPARKCVDNVLRYRRDVQEKQVYKQQLGEYKQQLDSMVQERRRMQNEEVRRKLEQDKQLWMARSPWGRPGPGGVLWRDPGTIGLNFFYSLVCAHQLVFASTLHFLGWSDETTMRCLENQRRRDVTRYDHANNDEVCGGVELVPLLARRRPTAERHPLTSTDVTRIRSTPGKWIVQPETSSEYTRELTRQVVTKQQQLQESRQKDFESSRRHFETWQHLWGRPGHGAPREVKVKANLDALLHHITVK